MEEKTQKIGRDEEIDIARAIEIAREFIRDNVGSLSVHQFRIESVNQNGSHTRYIVICSIIPDLGEERQYYLLKVDIKTGKLVSPLGRGRKVDGNLQLQEMKIESKWTE